jgi:hypothetical protein
MIPLKKAGTIYVTGDQSLVKRHALIKRDGLYCYKDDKSLTNHLELYDLTRLKRAHSTGNMRTLDGTSWYEF